MTDAPSPSDESQGTAPPPPKRRSRRGSAATLVILLALAVAVRVLLGIFVVPPIGAAPEGRTIVWWRFGTRMDFIESPDGLCMKIEGGVSLLCRAVAIGSLPRDRILVRLPYFEPLYLLTTDGRTFGGPAELPPPEP